MGTHFMSVLGNGKYETVNYKLDLNSEKGCKTLYIQEALISLMFDSPLKADDKITIFTTNESETAHWNPNDGKGLAAILNEKYPEKAPLNSVNIPSGKNNDELMQIFNILYNSIEENDEIIFDITHSFRSIPMFVLTVLCYARVLKNIEIKGIYYGALDDSVKDDEGLKIASILDMTIYMNIIDWSFAAQLMTEYGNAEMMCKVYEEQKKSVNIEMKKQLSPFEKAVDALGCFTNCIQTSRGKINKQSDYENSISKAYERFLSSYKEASQNNSYLIEPLAPLFKKIIERTKDFDNKSNLESGLATVKWCIDHKFTQQGLTALEETIKTYVCIKFGLDETNRTDREDIAGAALNIKARSYKESNIQDEIKKHCTENNAGFEKIDYNKYTIIEKIVNELDDEIVIYSKQIKQFRNDINHFGFSNQTNTYKILQEKLEKEYNEIIKIIQNDKELSK